MHCMIVEVEKEEDIKHINFEHTLALNQPRFYDRGQLEVNTIKHTRKTWYLTNFEQTLAPQISSTKDQI